MRNFSKVFSAELSGISARIIEVETDINIGIHNFTIVGLADKTLSESKERINAALKNSGVKAPNLENRRIVVNLAPADYKKNGSHYDLAIAVGYLVATKQIDPKIELEKTIFLGELALNGKLRSVNGVLSIAAHAKKKGYARLVVPEKNAAEAAMIPGIEVIPAKTVTSVIEYLNKKTGITPQPPTKIQSRKNKTKYSIDDIHGQENAKRALVIAAAGGHNLLMVGPPGTGKTMLANVLASLLPDPSRKEVLEMTQIHSAAGVLGENAYQGERPIRAPHQTASSVAIIGGGSNPRPGEISLAHRGVLFLDELPEFRRDLLESLRQPLEHGTTTITRIKGATEFPARFMLVAAMNPCPCGYYQDKEKECTCPAFQVERYQKKISGPLLDRIDLQIAVPRIKVEEIAKSSYKKEPKEAKWRDQIKKARDAQEKRFKKYGLECVANAELGTKEIEQIVVLEDEAKLFAAKMCDSKHISTRGYFRVIKVAQTIADLEGSTKITKPHVAEAFSYRIRN